MQSRTSTYIQHGLCIGTPNPRIAQPGIDSSGAVNGSITVYPIPRCSQFQSHAATPYILITESMLLLPQPPACEAPRRRCLGATTPRPLTAPQLRAGKVER